MAHASKPIVLVVEDSAILRLMAVDIVEQAGFDAIEAGDADEAVRILESRNDIRIVFTDIDMPGSMDGMKLAACIRDRWPPVEIILTSGHLRRRMLRFLNGACSSQNLMIVTQSSKPCDAWQAKEERSRGGSNSQPAANLFSATFG